MSNMTFTADATTVRANAFHLNAHSGLVRMVHFGNRAVSLEQFGVPSDFVIRADAFEEVKKLKVKEALCYLGVFRCNSLSRTNLTSWQHRSKRGAWRHLMRTTGRICTRSV